MKATTPKKSKTARVQAVIPAAVESAIKADALAEIPKSSVSRIASRILCQHYARQTNNRRAA